MMLAPFIRGAGDPTSEREPGRWWLAWRTPDGPVTATLAPVSGIPRAVEEVAATAWGPGAPWFLERLPLLLGAGDDPDGFEAHHDLIAARWRRLSGWRVPSSGLVFAALVCAAIEQRVTGKEAFASQAMLVRRFGTPAPGPGEERGLVVAPEASGWAMIPSWEWTRAGVDGGRARTVVAAARVAPRLEECVDLPLEAALRRLRALPGVGRWTAAEVSQRALGDPDSPSFGDYHVATEVTLALTGVAGDDEDLADLLAPYAGHRYRAQVLALAGPRRERHGPRRSLPTHLPTRWR